MPEDGEDGDKPDNNDDDDFVFDEDEWEDGRIYDPVSGKDYACYMKLLDHKTLKVRGYIGISLIGETSIWLRK